MNGVLNVEKPAGITSHDVVYRVRKAAQQKRVGHAGTLDPDATGVLLVCLGHAARLSDLLADQGKEYMAVLRLGQATSTEDASGDIIAEADPSSITEQQLANLLQSFIGVIQQVPPMVSAVHHEGKRLYELARRGITVERPSRSVVINSIDLCSFTAGANARASLRVRCGKGTYIRTLCADIGATLGVGGHMASLSRTAVGNFSVDSSISLADLTSENISRFLVPPTEAVSFLPAFELNDALAADVLNGKRLTSAVLFELDQIVRLTCRNELLGLGRFSAGGYLLPERVFPPEHGLLNLPSR